MGDAKRSETIELLEEQAQVHVRDVATGRVRVETRVEHFDEIARTELQSDVVDVTHVPVGRPITGEMPQIRIEGDLTVIPIFEEIMVVEKRLILKEEIHIRKRRVVETVDIPVSLRRQTADVSRIEPTRD